MLLDLSDPDQVPASPVERVGDCVFAMYDGDDVWGEVGAMCKACALPITAQHMGR